MPDGEAVTIARAGFLARLAGHFRQLAIGGHAYRTGDIRADIIVQCPLDPIDQIDRIGALAVIQPARQLINAFDGIDRDDSFDLGDQGIMGAAIEIGRLWDQHDIRTDLSGFIDRHDVLDAADLASREQAIITVRSVPAKGTTPTGRPRNAGRACCSTEAKKPSKSRYSLSMSVGLRMI